MLLALGVMTGSASDAAADLASSVDVPALTNGGFEWGSFIGWTLSSAASNCAEVVPTSPHGGSFHATVGPPISTLMRDSSSLEWNGSYSNIPTWGQAGASTATATSVRFDGASDRADIPWNDEQQSNTSFSFAVWARPMAQGAQRTILIAREATPARGFQLVASASNRWEFRTADGSTWHTVSAAPLLATDVWAHLVGTFDAGTGTKSLFIGGVRVATTTGVAYLPSRSNPLRFGAGSPESVTGDTFFNGFIDDVQLYRYALSSSQVAVLYNGGLGGLAETGLVGHYRLDENQGVLVPTASVWQVRAASTGQTWSASAYLAQPSDDPLRGSGSVQLDLQFLSVSGAVLQAFSTTPLAVGGASDAYVRASVRGNSPAGTTAAVLRITYLQDAALNQGRVFLDDARLTPLDLITTAAVPNCAVYVAVTGACGPVTFSQSPAAGTPVGCSNFMVWVTAADGCSAPVTCGVAVVSLDAKAPVFGALPGGQYTCLSELPPADSNAVRALVSDNCDPAPSVVMVTNLIGASGGCGSSVKVVLRRWQAIDAAGNFTIGNQVLQVRDSNAPVVTILGAPVLTNGGFDAGSLAGWGSAGQAFAAIMDTNLARTGAGLATFDAAGVGSLSQQLAAGPGETWRGVARVRQLAGHALAATNRAEVQLAFLDTLSNVVGGCTSAPLTALSPVDAYIPLAAGGITPTNCAAVRLTVFVDQQGTITNGPAILHLDDAELGRAAISVGPSACTVSAPDLRSLISAVDCNGVVTSQVPQPGSILALGIVTVRVSAADSCLQTNSVLLPLQVVEDDPPLIVSGPADLEVGAIDDVPPVNTGLVVAVDSCTAAPAITYAGATNNGGAGSAGSPLVIVRRYRAADASGNEAIYRHTITVRAGGPTAAPFDVWAAAIPNAGARGGSDDPDGDGALNLFEYSQGTQPTNPADFARLAFVQSNGLWYLRFNRVNTATDLLYEVQAARDLTDAADWSPLASNVAGGWGGASNVIDDNTAAIHRVLVWDPLAGTNRSLRLRVSRP